MAVVLLISHPQERQTKRCPPRKTAPHVSRNCATFGGEKASTGGFFTDISYKVPVDFAGDEITTRFHSLAQSESILTCGFFNVRPFLVTAQKGTMGGLLPQVCN